VLPRAFVVPFEARALHRPPAVPCGSTDLAIRGAPGASSFHGVLVAPSSRRQPAASTPGKGTQPLPDVPPSAFRTPSAVCSVTGLAGLFRPAATSRVLPFRGLSLLLEPHRLSPAVALGPLTRPDCGCPRRREFVSDSGPCSPA
jgi:hypothetical protein